MYPQPMTADAAALGRLGQEVDKRVRLLGLDYVDVARAGGFSVETLSKIRKGQQAKGSTYRGLERALRWAAGSVDEILAGGLPRELDESGTAVHVAAAPPDEETRAQADAVMTIINALPPRIQAEVARQMQERRRGAESDEYDRRQAG